MKFLLIKRSYFCVLHPLLGPQIKFMNFFENQPTLSIHWVDVTLNAYNAVRMRQNQQGQLVGKQKHWKAKRKRYIEF